MPYALSVHKGRGFLHVHVQGKRTREAVMKMSLDILDTCRQEKATRVLVDVRELTGRLEMLDAFEIPAFEFPNLKEASVLERAVIVDLPEYESAFQFFESVARNRGFNLRIFGDPRVAKAWLFEGTLSAASGTSGDVPAN